MKEEIYEDVLAEEPDTFTGKKHKAWEKRLHNSVGYTETLTKDSVFIDGKGKICSSPLGEERLVDDVVLSDGTRQTCNSQESADILALLVQMNVRLKRVENETFKKGFEAGLEACKPNKKLDKAVKKGLKV